MHELLFPIVSNFGKLWGVAGMLERGRDLLVAEDFWDFLGGHGAYKELLDCFLEVGIAMRAEIDGILKGLMYKIFYDLRYNGE